MGHFSSYRDYLHYARCMKTDLRTSKRICLVSGIMAYLAFHVIRDQLPCGFFRASFPSLLFIPVTLALVDVLLSLASRKPDWSERRATILFSTIIGILGFEVIGPHISHKVVGDLRDSVALAFGGLIYFFMIRNIGKNERAEQGETQQPPLAALSSTSHVV